MGNARNFAVVFLIVFAMALMLELTVQYYRDFSSPGSCESTCGASRSYYEMFGLPRSIMVLGVLAAMLAAYVARRRMLYRILGASTLAYGLYMTYLSITEIGFLCKYCEAVKVILAALLVLDFF